MREGEITQALDAMATGTPGAADGLLPLVYTELRAIAATMFASERGGGAGHTLQPTAVVHEAYARLIGSRGVRAENRAHFMALAAQVMRRVLIDHARAKMALKRGAGGPDGGSRAMMEIEASAETPEPSCVDVLDLDAAMQELAQVYPRAARVVEMRFFGGMSAPEIARLLDVGDATVERDWTLARGWLRRKLAAPNAESGR